MPQLYRDEVGEVLRRYNRDTTVEAPSGNTGGVTSPGVSQIIAGFNIDIDPPDGRGIVTIDATGLQNPWVHFDVTSNANGLQFSNSVIAVYEYGNQLNVFRNGILIDPAKIVLANATTIQINECLFAGDTVDILNQGLGDAESIQYGNANVAAFLPTYGGNVGNGQGYILGNGAFLSGLPAGYSNANVAAYLPVYGGNILVGNANVVNQLRVSNISQLRVPGGVTGQFITTDGQGNLSYSAAISLADPTFGNTVPQPSTLAGAITAGATTMSVFSIHTSDFVTGTLFSFTEGTAGYNDFYTVTANSTYNGVTTQIQFAPPIRTGSFTVNTPVYVSGVRQPYNVITFTGGVTAAVTAGGALQVNVTAGGGSTYSNANVANYLPVYSGNVGTGSGYIFGNGAFLTGITGGTTNYSNANVANYLPVYGGNVLIGNASVTGNISLQGALVPGPVIGGAANGFYFNDDASGRITETNILTLDPSANLLTTTSEIKVFNAGISFYRAVSNGTSVNTQLIARFGYGEDEDITDPQTVPVFEATNFTWINTQANTGDQKILDLRWSAYDAFSNAYIGNGNIGWELPAQLPNTGGYVLSIANVTYDDPEFDGGFANLAWTRTPTIANTGTPVNTSTSQGWLQFALANGAPAWVPYYR